jgi:hypothetical protein
LLTVTWLIHNNRVVLLAEQECLEVRECLEEVWDQEAAEDPVADEVKTVADEVVLAIAVTADPVAEVAQAEETAVLAAAVLAADLGQGAVPEVDLAPAEEVKEVEVKEVEVEDQDAWVLLILKAS